jgi:hypothetical protein
MVDRVHYATAAATLRLGNIAIVVGLLQAEAAELRARGRRAAALELERVAARLLRAAGAVQAPPMLDAHAVVLSESQPGWWAR